MRIITFGTFDLFHIGHLNIFKNCKNYLNQDNYFINIKNYLSIF